ncbi:MAG TPA: hypothetical protein VGO09_03490 [Flavisolibacter sp.]|jgi:hypothetical protein|nr:hypothetical protein [Flavisolibacter sp.]
MKKLIGFSIFSLLISISSVHAQSTTEKAGNDVKKGAKKAGNKTAEIASKGAAHIKDKVYKDKVGPDGQTIYINKHDKFYWIDSKGHKKYVTKAELKDKI